MLFADYQTTLQTLLAVQDTNGIAIFNTVLPNIINDAENRCYRALQLLNTMEAATVTMSAGSRDTTLPTGMIVVESVAVVNSAATAPSGGTAQPVRRVSRAALDFFFPTRSIENPVSPSLPIYFARLSDTAIEMGPAPDQAYEVEYVGTIRPAPLSASNPSTILTQSFPDLFLAASMVFGAAYQRDFGSSSDDPKIAMSWEAKFQQLMDGSQLEEQRRKAMGPGWTPMMPPPQGLPRDNQ